MLGQFESIALQPLPNRSAPSPLLCNSGCISSTSMKTNEILISYTLLTAGLSKINSNPRTKNYLPGRAVELFNTAILKSYTSNLKKKQGLWPLAILSLGWGKLLHHPSTSSTLTRPRYAIMHTWLRSHAVGSVRSLESSKSVSTTLAAWRYRAAARPTSPRPAPSSRHRAPAMPR